MRIRRRTGALLKAAAWTALVLGIVLGVRVLLGQVLRPHPATLHADEPALRARARRLHREALVLDGHDDVLTCIANDGYDLGMNGDEADDRSLFLYYGFPWLPNRPHGDNVLADMDLARIQEGGLDAQFFSVWVDCSFYHQGVPGGARQRALDMIEMLRGQERRHAGEMRIAYSAADVERIVSEGRLAALIGLEGGHAIEDDLDNLALFHRLGVRYMTLTHTCSHSWADSSGDRSRHGGLSEFGHQVVREMNRLGILVDVSHVSDDTFWDVMKTTKTPVIASHSAVRAIADHPRNMTDDMIRAVADGNGVVMINFMTLYVDPRKTAKWKLAGWHWLTHPRQTETTLSHLVDHFDHVVAIAGIDHVGLGSDFDNTPFHPRGLKDVGDLPNLTVALVRRGYSDDDIRKILGGNALRVLALAERSATTHPAGK